MKPHYVAKPIMFGGFHVGLRLYTRTGVFGELVFQRYLWSKK